MSDLSVVGLRVDLGGRRVVDDVDLACAAGTVTGVVGPNGSGKSTVCRAVYRALTPTAGSVRVGGADVHTELSAREAARRVAAVVQDGAHAVDARVHEIVLVGRTPHLGLLGGAGPRDADAVTRALERAGVAHLRERRFSTLSGGEKQRVLLARALAQQPDLLVLDEPTNHLDIAGQLDLLDLVAQLPVTVLVVLHDLNLAAAACDQVVVMAAGRVVARGAPPEVLTADLLREVFGVRAHCGTHPLTGRLQLSFSPDRTAPRTETP